MTISGGLRGLRPPATFWQPFRLLTSVNYMKSPINGAFETAAFRFPGVNAWATEKSFNGLWFARTPSMQGAASNEITHAPERQSLSALCGGRPQESLYLPS